MVEIKREPREGLTVCAFFRSILITSFCLWHGVGLIPTAHWPKPFGYGSHACFFAYAVRVEMYVS